MAQVQLTARLTAMDRTENYRKNSLSLLDSVAMGTGVMIGAGIFALTGQVAEQAGGLFPLAFFAAAVVAAFSAYSYAKMAEHFPSAGGIAMFLMKAYGKGTITAGMALLMYFSMAINESLVARTFGTYTLQLFDGSQNHPILVPSLGVGLLIFAFVINILGNKYIGAMSQITAMVKIIGIAAIALAGIWASGFSVQNVASLRDATPGGFVAGVALALLAYKGFTTITNSGDEIVDPKKNIARSIIVSLLICTGVYMLITVAVAGNLSIEEIVAARDYALAEAARPAFGSLGIWLTVILAIVATVSGLIASTFAVSRMLAMLTEMELVPHSHFGMPGSIQKHTLVYTVVIAIVLTVLLDLSRIASLGALFYIVMDMAIHWGVFKHLRREIQAQSWILVTALVLDVIILAALIWIKAQTDPLVLWVAAIGFGIIFGGERLFLHYHPPKTE
ncbi:MAG: amino acid permease [Pirellulaceae bacterium]|nr:MAG: amino acid permease [Pirellulaceae bacterium]